MRSYSIYLSLSNIFHLPECLEVHPCCCKWISFFLTVDQYSTAQLEMSPLLIGLCLTPPLSHASAAIPDQSPLQQQPLATSVQDGGEWGVQWRPKTRMMLDPQLEIVIIITRESGPGPMLVFSAGESGPGGGRWRALGVW